MASRSPDPGSAKPKGRSGGAAARRGGPHADVPDPTGDAPLQELSRDQLSVFLYVALLPEEATELVKDLGLSQPGFRRASLGEVQQCDLLADEIREAPETRGAVLDVLRKAFARLPLAAHRLDPGAAAELLEVATSESAAALALWRVLADRDEQVRRAALPVLDAMARRYFGPAEGESAADVAGADASAEPERRLASALRELEETVRKLAQAEERIESVRRKGEEQREKLQSWLKEARAREAQAVDEAARAREAAAAARGEVGRLEGLLASARSEEAAVEAQRARAQARDLEARAGALEARLERSRERERELEAEMARARGAAHALPQAPAAPSQAEAEEPEEAPSAWLTPIYTREFYDSLAGWDRRIQRAAFKQAHLLAQDHRHPSLRALPLQGLPGYYRVRVATDVRLLYRRSEEQNTVEILSLIDREDLDRYIKQAKTRG